MTGRKNINTPAERVVLPWFGVLFNEESAANDNTCEEGDSSQPVPYSPYVPVNISPSLVNALIHVCKDWPWSSPILTADDCRLRGTGFSGSGKRSFKKRPKGRHRNVFITKLYKCFVTLPFSLSACTQLARNIVNKTTSAFPFIAPSQL